MNNEQYGNVKSNQLKHLKVGDTVFVPSVGGNGIVVGFHQEQCEGLGSRYRCLVEYEVTFGKYAGKKTILDPLLDKVEA